MDDLSLDQARRVALGAQGFRRRRTAARGDRGHVRRVFDQVQLIQLDSVNVLVRSQELPIWARVGEHDRESLRKLLNAGELFEYWGHEASLIPIADWPLFRWKMLKATQGAMWGQIRMIQEQRPHFVEEIAAVVEERGEVTAGSLREPGDRRTGPWWDLSDAKMALEWLFWCGRITARRTATFERVYLPLRVIPEAVRNVHVTEDDARVELLAKAARALGVATERDLTDYFRLKIPPSRAALRSLEERGDVRRVQVEGWKQPAYLHRDAVVPRRIEACTVLSPFDSLVWERSRVERLWHFRYRIEIYTPAPKRVHGYYVLPFLLGDRLVARVDLKSDRAAGALLVQAAWTEAHAEPVDVAPALATELTELAAWLGLSDVQVKRRGDLAPQLRAAVRVA